MTLGLRLLHWAIILFLAVQAGYCFAQVLWVLRPPGGSGLPLFGAATSVPQELLLARRLYAIEGWIAFGALAVYLGITEILPARQRAQTAAAQGE
ncbi:MAG: hypothetical protein AB8H79_07015 [Myxococcota bacterium]